MKKEALRPIVGILGFLVLLCGPVVAGEGYQLLSPVTAIALELVGGAIFGFMIPTVMMGQKLVVNKGTLGWAVAGVAAGVVLSLLAYAG